ARAPAPAEGGGGGGGWAPHTPTNPTHPRSPPPPWGEGGRGGGGSSPDPRPQRLVVPAHPPVRLLPRRLRLRGLALSAERRPVAVQPHHQVAQRRQRVVVLVQRHLSAPTPLAPAIKPTLRHHVAAPPP